MIAVEGVDREKIEDGKHNIEVDEDVEEKGEIDDGDGDRG